MDAYKGGLISAQSTVDVSDDNIQELNFRLVRDQAQTAMEEADASIVVEAQRETSEVSVKTLSADQIQYLPAAMVMWSKPFKIFLGLLVLRVVLVS